MEGMDAQSLPPACRILGLPAAPAVRPLPYMGPVSLSEQEHCSEPLGRLLTPWGADGRALTYHILGAWVFLKAEGLQQKAD